MTVNQQNPSTHAVCLAPMMAYTDRHFRMLIRLLTKHTWLYTEMVTTKAILDDDREKTLGYSSAEHPIGLQIGGSHLKHLALSSKIAEDYGYDEINLNVGCPSNSVQSGQFGACLFKEPLKVAECVDAMQHAVDIPVSVKTRIGVDDIDSYEHLYYFIDKVSQAGCHNFMIHARKAWLKGLSPRENREVPPLRYEIVRQIKQDFPHLQIILNGGIKTLSDMQIHLQNVDGVMIGREAYNNPLLFREIDQRFYGQSDLIMPSAMSLIVKYLPYIAEQLKQGVSLRHFTRHLLGFFQGIPGAKHWRRHLTTHAGDNEKGIKVIEQALSLVNI